MMKVLAIDDEPLALELIEAFTTRFDFLKFERGFANTTAAFHYLEKNKIDLLFLDINMPAISGIDFFKSLSCKPILIFTTSYGEYAIDSYELGAIDYLLKPFTPARFELAVNRAYEHYTLLIKSNLPDESKYVILKADYGVVKLIFTDILYIEGLDNYLKIILQNGDSVIIRQTLKTFMEKVPEKEFLRVHRSFIVPSKSVESIKHKTITLYGGKKIPIGRSYDDFVKNLWRDLI